MPDRQINRPMKSGFNHLTRQFSLALIIGASLSISTPLAHAQLQPVTEKPVTLESKVDSVFGTFVGAVASVLFWDVVFWDNDAPTTSRAQFEGVSLPDPIGWGVFTYNSDAVIERDFAGQPQNTYSAQGVKVSEAWVIQGGKRILVRSKTNEAYLYQRVALRGTVGAPVGPLKLPTGDWVSFSEVGGELIFGASDNRVYALSFKGEMNAENVEWRDTMWGLESTLHHVSARADGRYRLMVSADGSGGVLERVKAQEPSDGQAGVKLTDRVALSWSAPKGISGAPVASGFASDHVWVAFTDGVAAWSAQDGRPLWSHAYPQLNGVSQVSAGAQLGFKTPRGAYLLTSASHPATLISDSGEVISLDQLKLDAKHPLLSGVESASVVKGALWVTKGEVAQRLSLNDGELFKVSSELKQMGASAVTQSGGYFITQGAERSTLWWQRNLQIPLIVIWLVFGALLFTLRMRFVNIRLFRHAIDVVRGKYTDPNAAGEVSHFQALTSALSATVGLGNIAGVAIAVSVGGPGATFWMIVAGFLGMASKFTECTLGQKYRRISPSGEVMGGAMHYLSRGLEVERGLPRLGKALAILFCILCVGASFGGGNAFQVKQSLDAVVEVIPALGEMKWVYGVVMAVSVGVVILGGIKSIAQTAEKIVPAMCGVYLLASLYVILAHASQVPSAITLIITSAFSPDALYGGAIGVIVLGFKRAAFSNEAGIGSAAIAHAAAKTDYPVREGVVALLEPFIDTIVVCTMTALVIVITGAYQNPEFAGSNGAALTSKAMGEVISFFPYVLSVAVILFAYSTMISWSYYGERCWAWLFGEDGIVVSLGAKSSLIYRVIFLMFAFLGSIVTATNILDFSDLMILGMALPNILGLILLTRGVRADLDEYEEKLDAGEFKTYE